MSRESFFWDTLYSNDLLSVVQGGGDSGVQGLCQTIVVGVEKTSRVWELLPSSVITINKSGPGRAQRISNSHTRLDWARGGEIQALSGENFGEG